MDKRVQGLCIAIAVTAAFALGYALRPGVAVPAPAAVPEGAIRPEQADKLKDLLLRCPQKMDRVYVMERTVAFSHYLAETNCGNEAIQTARKLAYEQAMELPADRFILFSAIGKGAKIRLKSGFYPLTFGELCIPERSGKCRIQARILPDSCQKISHSGCTAILKWRSLGSQEAPLYYLCLWDRASYPAAMYQIGGAKLVPERDEFRISEVGKDTLEVKFTAGGKAYRQEFSAHPLNAPAADANRILFGGKDILADRDVGVAESMPECMLGMIVQETTSIRKEMSMAQSFKVLFADDELFSYEFCTVGYAGGAHGYSTRQVGSLRNRKNQPITLSEVVSPEEMPRLTALLRKEIARQMKCKTYEEARKQLLEDVYPNQNFYYDNKGLHFIFNPCEIGPYAMGPIDLCVKWPRP